MRTAVLLVVAVLALLVPGQASVAQAGQKLEGEAREQAEEMLKGLLLNKRLVSRVNFPAWTSGIDLSIDGTWIQRSVDSRIKSYGLGIAIDEPALVTDVVLKGKHVEIHLNGGGRGSFSDFLSDLNRAQLADATGVDSTTRGNYEGVEGLKQPGGSRINLRFDRDIGVGDLAPDKLIAFLDPLVDVSVLRQEALAASIPEEFREAAERREVISGMDKQTVFAIFGEPVQKSVDLESAPPTEKWQYDRPDLTTVVVTFVAGKVTRVDIF